MAEPLARFEGFEGFQGFEGFEAFEGGFGPLEKKIWRARAPSPQSSKCEVLERLKRPWSV